MLHTDYYHVTDSRVGSSQSGLKSSIKAVPSNNYAFCCVICDKAVFCEHMGEADVSRNMRSSTQKKNINKEAKISTANCKQACLLSMHLFHFHFHYHLFSCHSSKHNSFYPTMFLQFPSIITKMVGNAAIAN